MEFQFCVLFLSKLRDIQVNFSYKDLRYLTIFDLVSTRGHLTASANFVQ
jgi:hypothetical protein